MYNNMLVTCIKTNGKVLRENKDTVALPFGSEYSVFVKNLNSLKCLVNVSIDGKDIADGTSFIVPANGEINIERFIKEGNLKKGNKFKFIERTAGVEAHRGVQVEDGLIRVEFEFELFKPYIAPAWPGAYPRCYTNGPNWTTYCSNSIAGGSSGNIARSASASSSLSQETAFVNQVAAQSINDAGITAPGAVSDQQFTVGGWFQTDGVKHVMVFKLVGYNGEQPILQPVTVKSKPKCVSCGKVNKAKAKFCTECGTGLEIA
jgi:hypothetical protein